MSKDGLKPIGEIVKDAGELDSGSPQDVAVHGLVRSNRITETWLTSRRLAISR